MKPNLKPGQRVIFKTSSNWIYIPKKRIVDTTEYNPEYKSNSLVINPYGKIGEILSYSVGAGRAYEKGYMVYFIDGTGSTFVAEEDFAKGDVVAIMPNVNKFWIKFNES